jgi:hypothetical protein
MTKEKISLFAETIIYMNNRVKIWFKDGSSITGYFERSVSTNELNHDNKWEFYTLSKKRVIIFDGNDFLSIAIYQI